MARSYGLDYESGYELLLDRQQKPTVAYCRRCGDEIYSESVNDSNNGLCDLCFYLSLGDDADGTEEQDGGGEGESENGGKPV